MWRGNVHVLSKHQDTEFNFLGAEAEVISGVLIVSLEDGGRMLFSLDNVWWVEYS